MDDSFKTWAVKAFSALAGLTTAIAAIFGAWYVFPPTILFDRFPFVALTFVATFCGIPVMAKWVTVRMLKMLKS